MSRLYEMRISIDPIPTTLVSAVVLVAREHWDFTEVVAGHQVGSSPEYHGITWLDMSGEGSLAGGRGEDEFARDITHAIWSVSRFFLDIRVTTVFLEDPPTETYQYEKQDYDFWKAMQEVKAE